jgi:hypothetical protein
VEFFGDLDYDLEDERREVLQINVSQFEEALATQECLPRYLKRQI